MHNGLGTVELEVREIRALGKRHDVSPDERRRRSERARELHIAGVFGGPQPGSGRPFTCPSCGDRVKQRDKAAHVC